MLYLFQRSTSLFTVYVVENDVNKKKYIGFTSRSVDQRLQEHIARAHKKADTKFYRAIRKYGEDHFSGRVLEVYDDKDPCLEAEVRLIQEYGTIQDGYNTHIGGKGGNTGAYHKVGKKGSANPMFGKKQSREAIEKAQKKRNKWLNTEEGMAYRRKMADKWKDDNPGKNKTNETKKRISEGKKGCPGLNPLTFKVIHPCGKVQVVTNLSKFCSEHNLERANASRCIAGVYKTCKGFRFQKFPGAT